MEALMPISRLTIPLILAGSIVGSAAVLAWQFRGFQSDQELRFAKIDWQLEMILRRLDQNVSQEEIRLYIERARAALLRGEALPIWPL